MSKQKGPRFSKGTSRNSYDTTLLINEDGRMHLRANDRGVDLRTRLLVDNLGRKGAMSKVEATLFLKSIHSSYAENDLKQPFRHLIRWECARWVGSGKNKKIVLTKNGKKLWESLVAKRG